MKNTLLIALCAAAALVSGCATTPRSSTAALQGTWKGRELGVSPGTPRELVISGTHLEYRGADENDWGSGTFTLREDTLPKQLLIALTDCGAAQYVGKTVCLIFKLEQGTLTVAANEPGNPVAPLSFDAPDARRMVFKKQ